MSGVYIHEDAQKDLEAIGNEWIADKIYAFLQEAREKPELLDTFTVDGHPRFGVDQHDVRQWVTQQKRGRNLWRINLVAIENSKRHYRIVYAVSPRKRDHFVLGVVNHDGRTFDYEPDDAFTERIVAVYDSLQSRGLV